MKFRDITELALDLTLFQIMLQIRALPGWNLEPSLNRVNRSGNWTGLGKTIANQIISMNL